MNPEKYVHINIADRGIWATFMDEVLLYFGYMRTVIINGIISMD